MAPGAFHSPSAPLPSCTPQRFSLDSKLSPWPRALFGGLSGTHRWSCRNNEMYVLGPAAPGFEISLIFQGMVSWRKARTLISNSNIIVVE